jgi:TonB family protein
MKKILSLLYIILACANTAIAQVTVSRSELVGTKWVTSEAYESHSSLDYVSDIVFTKDAVVVHSERGSTNRHPFYLSNTIPNKFDFKKVGVSTKGCYYNEYLDEKHFCCWAIMSFDKSKGIMTLELKNEQFIGPSTTTFIRIDNRSHHVPIHIERHHLPLIIDPDKEDDYLAGEVDTTRVYDVVEQMPCFPGGNQKMQDFIKKNLQYPKECVEKRLQGRVIIAVVVERNGTLTNIRVVKSVNPALDKEALRIVNLMPKWIPGRQCDKTVRVKYIIPITFQL